MLRIECPWCGPRAEIEFRCGGQTAIQRPGPPGEVSDADWAKYLTERLNPRGLHHERWVHSAGCRRWFNLVRDTRTHAIATTYRMGEGAPSDPVDMGVTADVR